MSLASEHHYAPNELGNLWKFSGRFIRELFEDEPGVIKITRPEQMNKRRYTTLRIPESVATRVHSRLRN